MPVKVMLCPNPNRSMLVDRVIVIGESEDKQSVRVLNVDAIGKDPKLMLPYGKRYALADIFWRYIAIIVLIVGVVFSFLWHWWAFIPGFAACTMILKATRQSTVDFAVEILANNKNACADWARLGLIWDAPIQSLVPDNT